MLPGDGGGGVLAVRFKLVLSHILQSWVVVEETLDYIFLINLKQGREEKGRGGWMEVGEGGREGER